MTEPAAVKGPRKRHTGGKKGARKPSRLLADMRLVYAQPREKDLVRHGPLRQLLLEDPKGFIGQLAALERAHASRSLQGKADPSAPAGQTGTGGGPLPVGPQEEALHELMGRLLDECEGKP